MHKHRPRSRGGDVHDVPLFLLKRLNLQPMKINTSRKVINEVQVHLQIRLQRHNGVTASNLNQSRTRTQRKQSRLLLAASARVPALSRRPCIFNRAGAREDEETDRETTTTGRFILGIFITQSLGVTARLLAPRLQRR